MTDVDLRERLAALDPARDLAPLDAAERLAVVQRAADGRRSAPRPRRTAVRIAVGGLVAVAAAATAVAVVLPMTALRSDPAPERTITLAMPSDLTAMCMPVADFATDALAASTVALRGTVVAVDGERVGIRVDRLYRGGPATAVVLRVPGNVEDPTTLTEGEQVLVAAQDDQVLGCGLSGEASPDLQRYYDAAF